LTIVYVLSRESVLSNISCNKKC